MASELWLHPLTSFLCLRLCKRLMSSQSLKETGVPSPWVIALLSWASGIVVSPSWSW